MQALAASGVSTVKHFHAELDQLKNALSVSTNFDLDTKTLAGLKVAFKNVQCLGLNISSRKQSKLEDEDDGIDRTKGGKVSDSVAKVSICFFAVGVVLLERRSKVYSVTYS